MIKTKAFKSTIITLFISLALSFSLKAQMPDFTHEKAIQYLDTANILSEIEGIWTMDMTSYVMYMDTLASKGTQNPFTSYFIVREGYQPDYNQDYNVYRIDTTDTELSLNYQGLMEPTSLPGIYYFYYRFGNTFTSRGVATLSPGKLNADIVYPDTVVKQIFTSNYDPNLSVYISLKGKKKYPFSLDINTEDGMTVSYLDSNFVRVRNGALAKYYRKVKLSSTGVPQGLCTLYYLNGKPMWEAGMTYYDPDDSNKDIPQGKCRTWYESGKIESEKVYNDGYLDDTLKTWYENGRPKSLIVYSNGIYNGEYRTWFEDGSPELVAEFNKGNVVGNLYTVYTEEGHEKTIFFDNFTNNKMGWPVTETKNLVININDDALNITSESNKPVFPAISAPFDPQWNFELECKTVAENCRNDLFYGIVFGKKDDDNFQLFAINTKGEFIVGEYVKGKLSTYTDPKISEFIKTDGSDNVLSVRTWGGMIFYSINTEDVYNTFKKELKGNGLGMYISGKGTFSFTDLSMAVNKFVDAEEDWEDEDL
jgi:antitoxin component YwqK of YwqJK toxin-antitoxin module